MLKLNEIKPAAGATKQSRRLGRGQGSGQGCTAGRGNNGNTGRAGSGTKPYFEGGQTPLTRRIPKRGFHSPFKTDYQVINVKDLTSLEGGAKEITPEVLFEFGIIGDKDRPLKVLGKGELSKPLIIKAASFSKTAKEKIEKAKGKAEVKARV